jgi:hypothetical protein
MASTSDDDAVDSGVAVACMPPTPAGASRTNLNGGIHIGPTVVAKYLECGLRR